MPPRGMEFELTLYRFKAAMGQNLGKRHRFRGSLEQPGQFSHRNHDNLISRCGPDNLRLAVFGAPARPLELIPCRYHVPTHEPGEHLRKFISAPIPHLALQPSNSDLIHQPLHSANWR